MTQVNGQQAYPVNCETWALRDFLKAVTQEGSGKICFSRGNEAAVSIWTDGECDYDIKGWSRVAPPAAHALKRPVLHCGTTKKELEQSLYQFLNDDRIGMIVVTCPSSGASLHLWKKGGDALGVAGQNLKKFTRR